MLGLQQRYARVPSSPLTTAFSGPLVIAAPLPEGHHVEVAVTFDIVQAPAAFAMPVMQKRPWETPFQVIAAGWPPAAGRAGGMREFRAGRFCGDFKRVVV